MTSNDLTTMSGGADISVCGRYRWRLWRDWTAGQRLRFIMLNPSTADATTPDHTVTKCIGFARRMGWAGIDIVNLFALRSRDPKALCGHPDPVGMENDAKIDEALEGAEHVICAWGRLPSRVLGYRAGQVLARLERRSQPAMCLGRTADGQPRHPLMLAYSTPLEPYP